MSNVIRDLVIRLGLDISNVSSGAKKTEREIKKVEEGANKASDTLDKKLVPAVNKTNTGLDNLTDASGKSSGKIDKSLVPAVNNASDKIDNLTDATNKTTDTIENKFVPAVDKVTDSLDEATEAGKKTTETIEEELSPALDGATQKIEETTEELDEATVAFDRTDQAIKKTGKSIRKDLIPEGQRINGILQTLGISGGKAGEGLADGFSKARNQALALMAVFTGGRALSAFVGQTTVANSQLGYAAQRLNTNPQELWAANHAVMAMGGGENEVTSAMGSIQQMGTTPEGAARLANIFGQLGVTNYQQDIRNGPEALLRDVNQHTQGMDQGRKNNLLGQLGFGSGMINTVNQTTASFDRLIASKDKLAPTNSEISNSQQLLRDLRQFADVNDHFARVLENDVAPTIDKVVVGITKWEQENPNFVEAIEAATVAIAGLGTALGALKTVKTALSLAGLVSGIGGKGGTSGAPLGLLGRAGIAGLAASALWHPTDAGGSVERFIQNNGGDSRATRWLFGDRQKGDAKQAVSILQGMGFNRNAAIGIAGNIAQESNFDPTSVGDHGSAFGIGQWHMPRVLSILKQTGIDVRTANFADQVRAYGLEMQGGSDAGSRKAGSILSNPNITVMGAVNAVRQYNERPADRFGNEDALRYSRAVQIAGDVPASSTSNNSTQIGDVHIHVTGNADGTKIAQDFKNSLRKSLPIQNIYGQA